MTSQNRTRILLRRRYPDDVTLLVDFNMRDKEGRVLALLDGDHDLIEVGDVVHAQDVEGNRCTATVAKVAKSRPPVAHLELEGRIREQASSDPGAAATG
ncbi:MAG: hypothetical protein M3273_08310 [Actinomycetota bacterium]|nr:hypothetical protein [Actinomycetota bacterium]